MNQKLIKQLQNGEIAVRNDGTLDELREVLKVAFPKDKTELNDFYKRKDVFLASKEYTGEWCYDILQHNTLPNFSVKDFLKPDELTLEELIESVKKKAKDEGFNCDVVLEESKEFEVEWYSGTEKLESLEYFFKVKGKKPNDFTLTSSGEHLAKCLKEYLEKH